MDLYFMAGTKSPISFNLPSIPSSFPIPNSISTLHSKSRTPLLLTAQKPISISHIAKSKGESQKASPTVEIMDDRSLYEILNSVEELSDNLREIICTNLDAAADDEESISLIKDLISNQPSETEWKFLAAQLLSESHKFAEAKQYLEEVLESEPLSMEALYELAIVMNRLKEDSMVQERLQKAMNLAKSEFKEKEVREIRIIMAQMLLLQDKLEESLKSYEELASEDSEDCRPYVAQGVIYTLMNKDKEAKEKFEKLKEIAGDDLNVEDFNLMQNGLRRIKDRESDEDSEQMSLRRILELELTRSGGEF